MDAAAAAAPRVAIPTLTLMGARDEVLRPALVREGPRAHPGRGRLRYYPDGWHWLFRDLQAARVWRDVAEFTLAVAAGGPGSGRRALTAWSRPPGSRRPGAPSPPIEAVATA